MGQTAALCFLRLKIVQTTLPKEKRAPSEQVFLAPPNMSLFLGTARTGGGPTTNDSKPKPQSDWTARAKASGLKQHCWLLGGASQPIAAAHGTRKSSLLAGC